MCTPRWPGALKGLSLMPESNAMGTVTHLMRAPVVGGSELETLTIVKNLTEFNHRLVFPEKNKDWPHTILHRFPENTRIDPVPDIEKELEERPPELLHIQFPFIIEPDPQGLDSVLELRAIPDVPTVFTVHAAVNVPVLTNIDYLFHTEAQAREFRGDIPKDRITICPSMVELPDHIDAPSIRGKEAMDTFRILWVSRSEEGKFHPDVPKICGEVLDACPEVAFHFVGEPPHFRFPDHDRLTWEPCPTADLDSVYRSADLFWYYPDPRLHETWCRTVTEAMGCGLACVVAGHGAMCVQARNDIESLVVNSPADCTIALKEMAGNPDKRNAMGSAGRKRARRFFQEANDTLLSLYRRLSQKIT